VGTFLPWPQLWVQLRLRSMKEREQCGASVSQEGAKAKRRSDFCLVMEAGGYYC